MSRALRPTARPAAQVQVLRQVPESYARLGHARRAPPVVYHVVHRHHTVHRPAERPLAARGGLRMLSGAMLAVMLLLAAVHGAYALLGTRPLVALAGAAGFALMAWAEWSHPVWRPADEDQGHGLARAPGAAMGVGVAMATVAFLLGPLGPSA